jgi:hypothetical protein
LNGHRRKRRIVQRKKKKKKKKKKEKKKKKKKTKNANNEAPGYAFSPTSCHFLSLASEYSPQQFVLIAINPSPVSGFTSLQKRKQKKGNLSTEMKTIW